MDHDCDIPVDLSFSLKQNAVHHSHNLLGLAGSELPIVHTPLTQRFTISLCLQGVLLLEMCSNRRELTYRFLSSINWLVIVCT